MNKQSFYIKNDTDLKQMPNNILDKVEEWQEYISSAKNNLLSKEPQEWCPEKYAHISFSFEGKQYVIYPQALNIDDTLFYYSRESIINTLKLAGAENIKYMGMID